jgi:putative membrane protein
MMWRGFGPGYSGYCGWGGGVGIIFMVLFWVIVIGLIVFAVTRMGHHGHMWHSMSGRDPLDIARERYAKGEIDENEFEKIKKNLS